MKVGLNLRSIKATYFVRRILSAIFTLWIALTINFLLPRMMGGNPADLIASQSALGSLEYAQKLKVEFGLDKSLLQQYLLYFSNFFQGNLGISFSTFPVPVWQIITNAIPWTLLIVITSTIISFLIAWVLGTLAALKKGSFFDRITVGVSFYVQSTPYFFVGMIILMLFGFTLGWFPMGHALPPGMVGDLGPFQKVGAIAYHAFLPVLSLIVVSLAGRMVMMRSNVLQVFSEDYITLAQAKGLRRSTILRKYALRNAMLPSFTGLMLSLGSAIGGAIATEMIYSYPGIGLTIMNAILSHDYPLIQGCFSIIALSVVSLNLIADFTYPFIDPRVTLS
jgi:peptide/nickel transport system permease protein